MNTNNEWFCDISVKVIRNIMYDDGYKPPLNTEKSRTWVLILGNFPVNALHQVNCQTSPLSTRGCSRLLENKKEAGHNGIRGGAY